LLSRRRTAPYPRWWCTLFIVLYLLGATFKIISIYYWEAYIKLWEIFWLFRRPVTHGLFGLWYIT
jgi:hypothetical protein